MEKSTSAGDSVVTGGPSRIENTSNIAGPGPPEDSAKGKGHRRHGSIQDRMFAKYVCVCVCSFVMRFWLAGLAGRTGWLLDVWLYDWYTLALFMAIPYLNLI